MSKALLRITLLLLVGTVLILLVEHLDARNQGRLLEERTHAQLAQIRHNLQQQFDLLVSNSEQLATELAANPSLLEQLDQHPVIQALGSNPAELTLSFTRQLEVVAAFPAYGSESVLGINFLLSPEFMVSIRRALTNRATVMDSQVTLRQTNKQGFIIRTPYFDEDGSLLGMVTSAVDLQTMLEKAGWHESQSGFDLLIEARSEGRPGFNLFGDAESFRRMPAGETLTLPENTGWELRARPHNLGHYPLYRSDIIRLGGAAILTTIILLLLYRDGLLTVSRYNKQGMAIHTSVLLVVILPIVLLVGAIAIMSFNATQQAAERLMQQQAGELARQIRARVEAFFDIPRLAAFDVELFRNGVLSPDRPEEMLSIFLSQLRVQPQLTFLSMANTEGEYFAASRPPAGNDRNLRLQFATLETDREMRVHWVNLKNGPSESYIRGNRYFDARDTTWYQQALEQPGMRWYPVYRYNTQDPRNQYRGLGIGISSTLYDADNRFLGVITADVALLQMSEFLKNQTTHLGRSSIFIAESNGNLLASSDDSMLYLLDQQKDMRVHMSESSNPVIRSAAAAINTQKHGAGNKFIMVGGEKHLLDWQTISLPDGPSMLVATILPQNWISSTAAPVLRNVLYLAALLLGFGIIAVLFLLSWLTRPLLRLEAWASQLGSGQWQTPLPPDSSIREISSLSKTLGTMAGQLRSHADELEQKVDDRTRELAIANQKLAALSLTDGLTGIANRRHFDRFIQTEWQRAQRSGQSVALLMIDVDNFKHYNDLYGHAAGDQALTQVAQQLDGQVRRAGDLVCRYGGEEFAVVMAQASHGVAQEQAEKLCQSITNLQIPHLRSGCGMLSISIGVAAMVPDKDSRLDDFLAAADKALYQAKKLGRNQAFCNPDDNISQKNH